jgi:hypothetical protein
MTMRAKERDKAMDAYQELRMVRSRIGEVAERHPRIAKEADFVDAYDWAVGALDALGEALGVDWHHQEDGYGVFFGYEQEEAQR